MPTCLILCLLNVLIRIISYYLVQKKIQATGNQLTSTNKAKQPEVSNKPENNLKVSYKTEQPEVSNKTEQPEVSNKTKQPKVSNNREQPEASNKPEVSNKTEQPAESNKTE